MEFEFRELCAELVSAWDNTQGLEYEDFGRAAAYLVVRAREALAHSELLEVMPEGVSNALVQAECALADICEGDHDMDSASALSWAEQRAANTLSAIRPVLRQHGIQTSEWPPTKELQ